MSSKIPDKPKLRVSDVGVVSVDSNELARSKAGRKQIEALERLLNKSRKGRVINENL